MAMLLRMIGHEVRTAYDGTTGLDSARAQSPEVVLCDVSMPGMDGLEVARRLRGELGLRDALLVAVTGYSQEEDKQRSEQAGFNAHMVKPISLDVLAGATVSNGVTRSSGPLRRTDGFARSPELSSTPLSWPSGRGSITPAASVGDGVAVGAPCCAMCTSRQAKEQRHCPHLGQKMASRNLRPHC